MCVTGDGGPGRARILPAVGAVVAASSLQAWAVSPAAAGIDGGLVVHN